MEEKIFDARQAIENLAEGERARRDASSRICDQFVGEACLFAFLPHQFVRAGRAFGAAFTALS
ncbi:MAG TPA: hypothetical protein VNU68_09785 [Verrucomicrobiae bacterium]|nr:hypothetical protein [Verrucomicrobiae bacterium]